jgi:DNA repair protein RadD
LLSLRDYQRDAVERFLSLAKSQEDCRTLVSAPTGSGKSIIIAEIVRRCTENFPKCNVLILQHRKELIEQNASKLVSLGVPVSIYSAGLSQKEIGQITVAGIQSIYKKDNFPIIHLVIIDEAHLLSPNQESMYQKVLGVLKEQNPKLKLLGLTATPYRLKTGLLVQDDGLFNSCCYNIEMRRLIRDGWLSPVYSQVPKASIDTKDIQIRGGEFILEEAAKLFTLQKSQEVIRQVLKKASGRQSILIFSPSVAHAEEFTREIKAVGESAECITGATLFRDSILEQFKDKKIRFLINCEVLTTGYDAPNVDCVVLLRPTQSPGLFVQMVGRGMRTCEGKKDCLVLDFAGNIERHGPIDAIEVRSKVRKVKGEFVEEQEIIKVPVKVCPKCDLVVWPRVMICPDCFYQWPIAEKHGVRASNKSLLSEEIQEETFHVQEVSYSKHNKAGSPPSFKITYLATGKFQRFYEFLCFEHKGFASQKARQLWQTHSRGEEVPETVDEALELANSGALKNVVTVKCRKQGEYWSVIAWKYGEKDEIVEAIGPVLEEWEF